MKAQASSIARDPPDDVGLNYSALVAEGIALVQALSGEVWTNFNYSDPGVTILEQLCYTLTELSYRADFPVADLLGAPGSGRVALERQALYPAPRILPINPLTPDDLRRLLLDRVSGLANIWFTPLAATDCQGVGGLYRIDLLPASDDCACPGPDPGHAGLVKQVLDCYGAHRALCEDFHACNVLQSAATRVTSDIYLADGSDPDEVMAALLFALGLNLSPEPQRTSLAALRAAGRSSTEIFRGPLMTQGFIGADQLAPLPRQMPVSTLLEAMASVTGVLSVETLQVKVAGDPQVYTLGQTIPYPDGYILRLDEAQDSLRLWDEGVRCLPNPARVQRLLDRAWSAQRRRYPLWQQYREFYRPPKGSGADLAAYSSVQEQFPAVYGIGHYGLPSGSPPLRQAQARQLKGYLMPFDQLMADFFSQVAFVRELFSLSAGGGQTYTWQSLRHIVPKSEELLAPGYRLGMGALVRSHDPVQARQNAFYDFLLSLYALELTPPASQGGPRERLAQGQTLLQAKRTLLARTVAATAERGRGIDYRHPTGRDNQAGMAIRARIELGLRESGSAGACLSAAPDPLAITLGQKLTPADAARIGASFLPVEDRRHADEDGQPDLPFDTAQVAPALLPALADPARYRLGALREYGPVCLVCLDMDGHWWLLDEGGDAARAVALTAQLVRAASGGEPSLYIVEWTLLRYALDSDDDGAAFSFGISAVLPLRRGEDGKQDAGWRRQARAILRDNTPAHVVVETHFLHHERMHRFLRLYEAWRSALRHHSRRRKAACSRRLADFLGLFQQDVGAAPALPPVKMQPLRAAGRPVVRPAAIAPASRNRTLPADTGDAPTADLPEPGQPVLAARVAAAPPGARGAYVHGKLNADTAANFHTAGFAFVMRDLSREAGAGGLLSAAEAAEILQAGLALMPVQTLVQAGWTPDAALGTRDGKRAAAHARCADLPAGLMIWLRPPALSLDDSGLQAYCQAWCAALSEAGYRPGLHVDAGLSAELAEAVQAELPFEQYWRGAPCLPVVSAGGYSLLPQPSAQAKLAGLAYEELGVVSDALGATPYWCEAV